MSLTDGVISQTESNHVEATLINSSNAGDRIFRLWRVKIMPADALAPKVARASVGMVLSEYDRQHVELLHCEFGLLLLNKLQDMIRNVNISIVNFKTIQHLKS